MLAAKNKCTGCGNCVISCRQEAISFYRDNLDNLYPQIDGMKCVKCGICNAVCPVTKKLNCNMPKKCFAAFSIDSDIRRKSASGGVSTSINKYLSANGYICAGVYMNSKYEAHFDIQSVEGELEKFQNSKYTFSFLDNIFVKIADCLSKKKKIVFSGLPCQVAALKQYLKVNNVNTQDLITVDLICHGIPSDEYLKDHIKSILGEEPSDIYFRDEQYGTYNFVFSLKVGNHVLYHRAVESDDNYQIAYHNATFYRSNCYECDYACPERTGDVTVGDFSGLGKFEPVNFDVKAECQKGISCVLVNTNKGEQLICDMSKNNHIFILERPLSEALNCEPQLKHPSLPSRYRYKFLEMYPKNKFSKTCNSIFFLEKIKRPLLRKVKNLIKKMLGKPVSYDI